MRRGLVFCHASSMSPHVPQPSGLSAKHKASSFAWGGLLSLLGGRLCISGCPLLSDVCAVSEGCHAQGLMATLCSASLRTWHRFATWIACGVLWCVEMSAGESASLPSADKCGIIGLTFATWVLGVRRASRMSHPQTAGPPIIGVQTSVRRGRGLMLVYTRVCHSMCPGTLPRKFEIEIGRASCRERV